MYSYYHDISLLTFLQIPLCSNSISFLHINSSSYVLGAFNNNECVGKVTPVEFPLTNKFIFPLMMYSNSENSDLRFKLLDLNTNEVISLNQGLNFVSDMRLGNGLDPLVVVFDSSIPNEVFISNAYPNPFNPVVNIDVDLVQSGHLRASIYNVAGQEVASIYDGYVNQGYKKLDWIADNYSSGIYFINIEINGALVSSQKISLLK